ncbi:unnamed protein product, partial [Meganyctiphanes norvegica]
TGDRRPNSQSESQRRQHTASESSSRRQQNSAMIHEEIPGLDNIRGGLEQSPRQKENAHKGKIKKNLFTEGQEDHQKFTFKSRGKNKNIGGVGGGKLGGGQQQQSSVVGKAPFKSYSWNVFQLNKKAINEALDQVWSGVTITGLSFDENV